ncbi:hypothetical protein SPRG_09644 [Saprolegnia parasitica CBS 223.65]|uniref:TatD DNase n=1 Tax=Saprolegnia parasitica (strain CBS 223.65) TaxID=695850 RepID=A0A067CE44_SAPPC|nr:hypothetical protein SPRG_09644 [Saprolegnia parasitica CBS 223.65]KDO24811.1 hypothetical protein SPRG_09644 [Saprolegnia parasitica CBS 223.65]|eukprot:XP_012204459.1 hypothetical protein SPRG_09644 [Saprolegnia parasitica CBS 223.65]
MQRAAWVDAHCHLQDPRLDASSSDVLARAARDGVVAISSCACTEAEWARWPAFAAAHATTSVQLLPAFGIHPWFAGDASASYLSALEATLRLHPTASVGEIGLCKSRRGAAVPMAIQDARFREQLQLAARLERSVVVHCVGAYGKVLDALTQIPQPRPVVLHSFNGATEIVRSFARLKQTRVYFSIATKLMGTEKATEMLRAIPIERLLLETDSPDQLPLELAHEVELNEPSVLPRVAAALAATLQLPLEALAAQTTKNALEAYGVEEGCRQ